MVVPIFVKKEFVYTSRKSCEVERGGVRVSVMLYGVLTCDLIGSRKLSAEQRQAAQDNIRYAVQQLSSTFSFVLGNAFEFRFGDEWQVLLSKPEMTYTVYTHLLYLLSDSKFYCGIGIGQLSTPARANTHEADGPAFHLAREALMQAKSSESSLVFKLADYGRSDSAETTLHSLHQLLSTIREGRRDSQVVISKLALLRDLSIAELSAELGVGRSAVYHRLRRSAVREERATLSAIEDILGWITEDMSTWNPS